MIALLRRAMDRSKPFIALLFPVMAAACQPSPEEDRMSAPPPPPAAMIAPVRDMMPLDVQLGRLQAELAAAIRRNRIDDVSADRVYRAEAITDRILESDPAIRWLASDYDLEAWLRQLQALADRIVAQIRRDAPEEGILRDMDRLYTSVTELRAELARDGGGQPPTPLDSLLANYVVGPMASDPRGGSDDESGGAAGPATTATGAARAAPPVGDAPDPDAPDTDDEINLLGVPADTTRR